MLAFQILGAAHISLGLVNGDSRAPDRPFPAEESVPERALGIAELTTTKLNIRLDHSTSRQVSQPRRPDRAPMLQWSQYTRDGEKFNAGLDRSD